MDDETRAEPLAVANYLVDTGKHEQALSHLLLSIAGDMRRIADALQDAFPLIRAVLAETPGTPREE